MGGDMGFVDVAILSVIQGVTEFLPISSSGHLVLAQTFLGMGEVPVLFDLVLHLGTLGATVLVYYRLIGAIMKDTWLWLFRSGKARREVYRRGNVKMAGYIILSTAVTGVIGMVLRNTIEGFFFKPLFVSFFLLLTGVVLFATRFITVGEKSIGDTGPIVPVAIGFAQAAAMLPGVSRSGLTIATGLYLGMIRPLAGSYSFLLSIPSILGASIVEFATSKESLYALAVGQETQSILMLGIAGFLLSLITGYGALRVLLSFIKRGKLHLFSYYCITVALGSGILIVGYY